MKLLIEYQDKKYIIRPNSLSSVEELLSTFSKKINITLPKSLDIQYYDEDVQTYVQLLSINELDELDHTPKIKITHLESGNLNLSSQFSPKIGDETPNEENHINKIEMSPLKKDVEMLSLITSIKKLIMSEIKNPSKQQESEVDKVVSYLSEKFSTPVTLEESVVNNIFKRIITKFPYLMDILSKNDFKETIIKLCKEKSLATPDLSRPVKRKRDDDDKKAKRIALNEKEVVHTDGALSSILPEDESSSKLIVVKQEFENEEHISDQLHTLCHRRKSIVNEKSSINDIFKNYSTLFNQDEIVKEFLRICNEDIEMKHKLGTCFIQLANIVFSQCASLNRSLQLSPKKNDEKLCERNNINKLESLSNKDVELPRCIKKLIMSEMKNPSKQQEEGVDEVISYMLKKFSNSETLLEVSVVNNVFKNIIIKFPYFMQIFSKSDFKATIIKIFNDKLVTPDLSKPVKRKRDDEDKKAKRIALTEKEPLLLAAGALPNFLPDVQYDKNELQKTLLILKKAFENDKPISDQLMDTTLCHRRKIIVNEKASIDEIFENYPTLFNQEQIVKEFSRICNEDMEMKDKLGTCFVELSSAVFGLVPRESRTGSFLIKLIEKKSYSKDEISAKKFDFLITFLGLPHLLGEDVSSIFIEKNECCQHSINVHNEGVDPFLDTKGYEICIGKKHVSCTSRKMSVCTLLAAHYAFNIGYKKLNNFFTFVESKIFKLRTVKGNETVENISNKLIEYCHSKKKKCVLETL